MLPIIGWIYWLIYQLLSLSLGLIGLFLLIPFAALKLWKHRRGLNPMFPDRIITAWWLGTSIMFPWCNEEDGVAPGPHPTRWSAYKWSALRNSVNNMRMLPGASFYVDDTMTVKQYTWGAVVTQGWRQCVCVAGRHIGWMMTPDAQPGWRSWPTL